jgi:hypothetical protein
VNSRFFASSCGSFSASAFTSAALAFELRVLVAQQVIRSHCAAC